LRVSAAIIIAVAQPTPLSTAIAFVGQLRWHAPHSIQFSARASEIVRPLRLKTV
jgi:hypothetical protein